MVRDYLRDETYFKKYLESENDSIDEFKDLLKVVIAERGIEDEGVQNGFISLNTYHFNKLNAMYSGGEPLENIRDFIPEVIDSMENAWNGGHYVQMLWLLSIGIMLEIDDSDFVRLEKLIKTYELEDALIDFLLSSRGLASNESNSPSPLLHEDPYQNLFNLIHLDDQKQQIQKLKEYLEIHWYDGHEDTGWHDSHNHWDAIYTGYWSYESGAVAKILGLDDSSLKDVPYYPYDMVHYKD